MIRDLKIQARWTLFCTPLLNLVLLDDERHGRLKGCMLCVAEDGTIAVVVVDGFEL